MAGSESQQRPPDGQVAYLRKRLDGNIGYLDWSAGQNSKRAFRLKISGVLFGSVTTVLIGIGQRIQIPYVDIENYISIAALITSAMVSVLSAWEAFFAYGERWIDSRRFAQIMRRVRDELDYAEASQAGASTTKLDELFARFEKALEDAHTGYLSRARGNNQARGAQ